jgi:mono/diheme cytochrome c family protein
MNKVSYLHLAALSVLATGQTFAQAIVPALETSELEPALKGRVLIEEMNCVACHGAETMSASSRKAPRLSAVGGRVNSDYVRAFIAAPLQVKPGTLMPDLLGELGAEERRDAAESITHFLVSLNKDADFQLQAPDAVAAAQGNLLFHSVGCVACHSPRDPAGTELLRESSVPLGDLEKKYSHGSLSEFLQRPHATRPSGRMPDLRLPGAEIERITHYLLQKTAVPGHLAYTTWRGKVWEGLAGDVEAEKAGQVDDFSLEQFGPGKVPHHTAIRYAGFLRIENAGDYTFNMEMNGGNLLINGREVISEAPSDRRGTKEFAGTAKLASGWNPIELTYFHTGREPKLNFEMEGPDFARQVIPSSMLATSDKPIPVFSALKPDPALVEKGRAYFERFGCVQCHDDIKSPRREYTAMARLDVDKGCLSEDPGTPRFSLNPEQRKLIALALPQAETSTFTDQQMIDKTLVALNCIACHDRAGLGGIPPERNAYFTGTAEALGDQGRLPPPLTHVGAKLTKSWLTEILLRGGRQRPYLNTRMPLFGEANVGPLIERFEKVDALEEVSFPEIANIRESKAAGYEMMGSTGLSCIACHDFNGQKSGAGALELINVTKRLKKNWFHLYMRQPSRFHPTVIMPSYWPGGQAIRKEVLNGNTDLQIEALWDYLSDGTRAKSPKGLSRQSNELRVATETVMCRGRGPASYRGIGVGYPEQISLVFDSEEMALRQLWKGEFANVDHGSFQPRGDSRIVFPPGVPFHRLASMDDLWPYKGKTNYTFPLDHGYQYRGYRMDQKKRPTFIYHYGEMTVEDLFEDQLDEDGKAYFKRTMTFASPSKQEMFYFRAASGKEIRIAEKGWQIDTLNLRVSGGQSGQVRDGDPKELLIPLEIPEGNTVLQLEYRW